MAQRLSKETLDTVRGYYRDGSLGDSTSQYRWNHEDCPAGNDDRQRLYAKRTEDGSKVLCHCFNCGCSGIFKLTGLATLPSEKDPVDVMSKLLPWLDAANQYAVAKPLSRAEYMAMASRTWPYKDILSADEALWMEDHNWYGIRWNAMVGAWILPRGGIGFDFRTPNKKMWRVTHYEHTQDSKVLVYNSKNSDVAVICEDPISAMKIDMAGFAGVALCGSTLNQEDAFKLSMRFKSFIVWLDNDNKEVIANADIAAKRLYLYTDRVAINKDDRDPKRYYASGIEHDIMVRLKDMNNNKD